VNRPAPEIRLAVPAEAEAIRDLVERAYRGDSARRGWTHEADLIKTDRTSLAEISSAISDPDRVVLAAWMDGRAIGTVTVMRLASDRCYLGMLGVDPDFQAGGIGRELVRMAEQVARERFEATMMEMTVIAIRRELIAWYCRQGYAPTGETRLLPGMEEEFLRMEVLQRVL